MGKEVDVTPVFVEFIPRELEPGKIYISMLYHTAVHACLCGCGERTVTPLIEGQWTLIESEGKISLDPSIGNFNLPCMSHYFIKNNKGIFD